MSLINNYWLKCQFHKKLCFLSKNLYLFHTANQVVDASDYRDILPSIAPTKEESTWGEIGEPSNRLPPLRVLSIHSHCHLEKKENVLFYFLFLLNEKCRMTPRCKKCHLSCLLSLKLFVLLESFYLGVQKHENTSGDFFSQLTRVTKVLSLSRFPFHFNFLFYKYFYNIRDTKVLSHFLLFEFHLFFSPNIFTWHDVCPSACCNKKIIKIYCSQHLNHLNNCYITLIKNVIINNVHLHTTGIISFSIKPRDFKAFCWMSRWCHSLSPLLSVGWPAPDATCCHWSDRPGAGWQCQAFQIPENIVS